MSYVEFFTCRVAIQVCTGYFPNGRKRRWTFSMRGIRPDASVESIAAVVRALAPLLIYPIIKVRKVVKRTIIFDAAEFAAPAVPAAAVAVVPAAVAALAAENGTPRTSSPTKAPFEKGVPVGRGFGFSVGDGLLDVPCSAGVVSVGPPPRGPPVM